MQIKNNNINNIKQKLHKIPFLRSVKMFLKLKLKQKLNFDITSNDIIRNCSNSFYRFFFSTEIIQENINNIRLQDQ